MKKFEFKLEKLLSYKSQTLNGEHMKLAIIRKALEEQESQLENLISQKKKCELDFEKKLKGTIMPGAFLLHNSYMKDLEERIKEKQTEILVTTENLNKQIEKVKSVKLETKSLEILKDSRFDEYKKEDIKKSELVIEEFVSTSRINSGIH